ncbi:hypothetical protein Tco_0924033 [Tanacetum coccineum]|uniref:MAK10-like protein n=1 Tax=Tanacetum coccineum TaxID=301880 RepID=A0ABQ5D921_9ASTR
MEIENPIRTLRDYSRPSHEGYRNTIELPDGNNVVPLRSDTIRLVQNGCSFHELRSEDPNQHLKDFLKLVDSLDLDVANKERMCLHVPSTSDRCLTEHENQVQRLMEAHLAPKSPVQVNKIASTYKARGKWYTFKPEQNNFGGTYNPSWKSHPNLRWRQPQNSQNNFLNPPNHFQPNGSFSNCPFNNNPQNFNNQSSLEGLVSSFMASQDARLSKFEADFKQLGETTNKIDIFLKAFNDRMMGSLPSHTVKNPKLDVTIKLCSKQTNKAQKDQPQVKTLTVIENGTPPSKGIKSPSKLLSPKYQSQSSLEEPSRNSSSPKRVYFVNTITIIRKEYESRETKTIESDAAEDNGRDTIVEVEKEAEEGLDSSKPVIKEDELRDIKQNDPDDRTCGETKMVEEVKKESEESEDEEKDDPEYINTNPPSPPDPSISFITKKVQNDGDIMFVEIIKKYDDSSEEELEEDGNAVTRELRVEYFDRFSTRSKLAYHKSSEHTKSVYFRNEEDKRKGVDYVMNKILGYYKECLELGSEYLIRLEDEGGVM